VDSTTALGTLVGRGIGKFLTKLKLVVASGAPIFVDWHLRFLYPMRSIIPNRYPLVFFDYVMLQPVAEGKNKLSACFSITLSIAVVPGKS
jgi:hypothetical protein